MVIGEVLVFAVVDLLLYFILIVRRWFILSTESKANLTFRWEEEDKGDWQRGEPCLEWGN